MAKNPSHQNSSTQLRNLAECESVCFAEVDFTRPVVPRLVVQFSEGLSILVENRAAVDLAAEFIVAFRASENRIHGEGGNV